MKNIKTKNKRLLFHHNHHDNYTPNKFHQSKMTNTTNLDKEKDQLDTWYKNKQWIEGI